MNIREQYLDLLIKIICDEIYKVDGHRNQIYTIGGQKYAHALTMTGTSRMRNTKKLCQDVIDNNVEGNFVECGIWRGGQAILMNAVVQSNNENRKVFALDSFEGVPRPDVNFPADAQCQFHLVDWLSVSLDEVKENFNKLNLLTDNVVFLKGWFKNTIPGTDFGKIAVLRIDGDLYESTIQCLSELYHKIEIGGYVILDDFTIAASRKAIFDFRSWYGITEEIMPIQTAEEMNGMNEFGHIRPEKLNFDHEPYSVYWKKTSHRNLIMS